MRLCFMYYRFDRARVRARAKSNIGAQHVARLLLMLRPYDINKTFW